MRAIARHRGQGSDERAFTIEAFSRWGRPGAVRLRRVVARSRIDPESIAFGAERTRESVVHHRVVTRGLVDFLLFHNSMYALAVVRVVDAPL